MSKLNDLQERKLKLVHDMRSVNDAETFSQEKWDRIEAELGDVESSITRALKMSQLEDAMSVIRDTPAIENPTTRFENDAVEKAKRYSDAFEKFMRMPLANMDAQTRAILNTGTGSEGGYTVPTAYLTTVIKKLLDASVMRQMANVISTSSTTNIPLGDGRPSFALIAENGTFGATDTSFAQKVLGAYKLGGIIKASDELLQDSFLDIQSYLTTLIVEGIADTEETYFTTGTGSSQPTGILVGGSLGKTTTSATAVTLDEVLDLEYSLKAPYRANASFVMNSATELAIRKLKNTAGDYLWQPSLQVGAPNIFDGKPIRINEKMPSIGTGNKFIAFGDFKYFTIGDRAGIEIKRLDELYSGTGQVGWRVGKRFDSLVTQAEAIKYMANA